MERHLSDIAFKGQQAAQEPRVQRRMRMPAHVYHLPQKSIARVVGMQRINLRVLRAVKIIRVVALDRLVQKGEAQSENREGDEKKLPAQTIPYRRQALE